MDAKLTKEARKVLKSLYDVYHDRRKDGQPKENAIRFDSQFDIQNLESVKSELEEAKYLESDIIGNFELTDSAIVFMENFKKDTLLKWLEFGSGFLS